MKCKSWSNKINNFVVRRLKSLKHNNQQQQQSLPQTTTIDAIVCNKIIKQQQEQQQEQQQQQQLLQSTTVTNSTITTTTTTTTTIAVYNNNKSTMPASQPKEKASVVSLNERNFNELKIKDLKKSNSTTESEIIATADIIMATKISTAVQLPTANLALVNTAQTKTVINSPKHLQQPQHQQQQHLKQQIHHNSCSTMSSNAAATAIATITTTSTLEAANLHQQQQHHQQQRQSLCGCGNVSANNATTPKQQQQQQQQSRTTTMPIEHLYLNKKFASPLKAVMTVPQTPSTTRLAGENSPQTTTYLSNHNLSANCLRQNYQANGVIVLNNNHHNYNDKMMMNYNNNNNNNNNNTYNNNMINKNKTGTATTTTTIDQMPMDAITSSSSSSSSTSIAMTSSTSTSLSTTGKTTTTTTIRNSTTPRPTASISSTTAKPAPTPIAAAAASKSTTTSAAAPATPPKKSPKDFIFGKYIGEGSFSMVYLAVDVNTKREYAIKVCEKQQIVRERKQEYIKREREVMHTMTSVPGFVSLSCTFQDTRSLYFVMTYAKNGDLLPYINKVGSFDIDCTRHYAAELVLACEQLHRRNIVHRDLKPENILLDEDMHTLIADFGSAKILTTQERESADIFLRSGGLDNMKKNRCQSGSSESGDNELIGCSTEDEDEIDSTGSSNDTGSGGDDVDSPCYAQRRRPYQRYGRSSCYNNEYKRRGSFVGTAQYVSPEVLQNNPITPAADLWALGCIIYQMMSGLPPFRGNNDYMIFKDIIACNLDFPQGFDKEAEDLVKQLLCTNPANRLGAQDFNGRYDSIRSHAFFRGVNFDMVRQHTPPPISPFLPDLIKDEEFRLCEHLEPGLGSRQLTRLLGLELGCLNHNNIITMEKTKKTVAAAFNKTIPNGEQIILRQPQLSNTSSSSNKTTASPPSSAKHSFELTDKEKYDRLELQKSDKWHAFADGEVILKKGFVNKRKGLFARRRMLLLTTGPRLIYIDPVQMIKKGEIPWSAELRAEAKNFKIFFVHTPNRTYYLDDPEGYSLEWVAAIEKMHELTYKEQKRQQQLQQQQQHHHLHHQSNSMGAECSPRAAGVRSNNNNVKSTTIISAASTAVTTPKIIKTSSTISRRTLYKSASLLTTPFTIMKTASN